MEEKVEPKESYVYVYLDQRKPGIFEYGEYVFEYEPFYVGKGKGVRYKQHIYEARTSDKPGRRNVKKLKFINELMEETGDVPNIIKYKENLTNDDALELEAKMIKFIGRLNLNKGPLLNNSDGGYGPIGWKLTEEQLEQRRGKNNPMYGVDRSGSKAPFYGNHHVIGYGVYEKNSMWIEIYKDKFVELYENKMSIMDLSDFFNVVHNTILKRIDCWGLKRENIMCGVPKSEEHRRKLSDSLMGKLVGEKNPNHKYVYRYEKDKEVFEFTDLKKFCNENELNVKTARSCFHQKCKTHKGWKISRKLKDKKRRINYGR